MGGLFGPAGTLAGTMSSSSGERMCVLTQPNELKLLIQMSEGLYKTFVATLF